MAVGHAGHQGAERDGLRDARGICERCVALEHLVLWRADRRDLEEVVHDPQTRHAGLVGVAGDPSEGGADAGGSTWPSEVRDLQSNSHLLKVCRCVNPPHCPKGRVSPHEPDVRWPLVQTYSSEEHTSELQSRQYLVCRLLLDKK